MEKADNPQPLPLLPHQTPEEQRWEHQKGGWFWRILPLSACKIAQVVAKLPGQSAIEVTVRLTELHRLSAQEKIEVGNYAVSQKKETLYSCPYLR